MVSEYSSFDHLLTEYVGGHGLYQLKLTLLGSPLYSISPLILFLVVFSAYVPDHRCKIDGCDTKDSKVGKYNKIYNLLDFTINYFRAMKIFLSTDG